MAIAAEYLKFVVVIFVIFGITKLFKFWSATDKSRTRKEALILGFEIQDVQRDVPFFRGRKVWRMKTYACARYSLKRDAGEGTTWALLQRDKKYGAQLPNDYLIQAEAVSPRLVESLRPVAEEYFEELFEFEGTSRDVAVFWNEWGGKDQVERLFKTLVMLKSV